MSGFYFFKIIKKVTKSPRGAKNQPSTGEGDTGVHWETYWDTVGHILGHTLDSDTLQ